MGEINKEAMNRLKKLKTEKTKIGDEISYSISQIQLALNRIGNAMRRNDYPLILTMATEIANQNTKLQSAGHNIISIEGDIQHLLNNNPDIVKAEEAKKRALHGGMDIDDEELYSLARRATKQPAGVNRVTKPAKKKCAAPPAGKKRAGTRR